MRILRETGGSQSFLLSDVLPLTELSSCHSNVLVQGIEMGLVPAPLRQVHVNSNLLTGFSKVAVRTALPVEGVDFILSNDRGKGREGNASTRGIG